MPAVREQSLNTDAASFLQHGAHLRGHTGGRVFEQTASTKGPYPLSLDELVEPPATIVVDMSEVRCLADALSASSHLCSQQWPSEMQVPQVTEEAFDHLIAPNDRQPLAYHFYTDGSKGPDGNLGAGIVMLTETSQGWSFGGCLYKAVPQGHMSIIAEDSAIVWALIWALSLSTSHWDLYGHSQLQFVFNFDALGAGYLAAGYWNSQAEQWQTLMRSLAQVLQVRHGLSHIHWNYTKAHCGHPWNELADCLAKYAAAYPQPPTFWEF